MWPKTFIRTRSARFQPVSSTKCCYPSSRGRRLQPTRVNISRSNISHSCRIHRCPRSPSSAICPNGSRSLTNDSLKTGYGRTGTFQVRPSMSSSEKNNQHSGSHLTGWLHRFAAFQRQSFLYEHLILTELNLPDTLFLPSKNRFHIFFCHEINSKNRWNHENIALICITFDIPAGW